MESRYLKCFLHVIEQGSIAEAARFLDIAPATVAQRLKALETDVGCQLLQRTGRSVKPTVAGSRILAHAYTMLSVEEEIRAAASNTDLPPGPLKLGVMPSSFSGILPKILNQWVARYPTISVYIDPEVAPVLHNRVVEGALDVALLAHPNYTLPKTYCWKEFGQEELVLIAQKNIALEDSLHALRTQPFIRYDLRTIVGRMIDDYLKGVRIVPNGRFEIDGIVPIAEMVAAGLGVSIVPNSPVLSRYGQELSYWPLPPPIQCRTIGAMWMRSSARARMAETFVDVALEVLKKKAAT